MTVNIQRILIFIFLLTIFNYSVSAQETTSNIFGSVKTSEGRPVSGAKVEVNDTRTGASSSSSSGASGSFSITNLRVGGPYEVTVTSPSGNRKVSDVYLSLGQTFNLPVTLQVGSVDEVVVTASQALAADVATGPSQVYSLTDLQNLPAINRDIKDVLRTDPRIHLDISNADDVQCAGSSPRFNSLTVDGVRLNDGFGLNSNGYPTERMPFSYDAIEQVAVELAPFDVQYGGFSACNINAVTKGGTNEFHGGFFYDYTDDNFRGDSLDGDSVAVPAFERKRYGFNVGGPIVEDKLFFFVAYEKLEDINTFERGPEGSGAINEVAGFTQDEYDRIVNIARNQYQYEPGGTPLGLDVEDEKILLKLDANINDQHRASFTYIYNDGENYTESDSDLNEFEFTNHLYERGAELNSLQASIYSEWTDRLSSELRFGHLELDNRQIPIGGTDFGEVQVNVGGATVYLGADDSRHRNSMNYEITNLMANFDYDYDNHQISFGYELEEVEIFNIFVQHYQGQLDFNSIDDFENFRADDYQYENSPTGNVDDAAAVWGYTVHTLFLQDEISLMDNRLNVSAGLRYDTYESDETPTENPDFVADFGHTNAVNLDGADILMPRLAFDFDAADNLQLRGGIGVFSGGNPNVWVSNTYSGDHMRKFGVEINDQFGVGVDGSDGPTIDTYTYVECEAGVPVCGPGYGIPQQLYDGVTGGSGLPAFQMDALDPNFEIPSETKLAVGLTYTPDFQNSSLPEFLKGEYLINADYILSEGDDSAKIIRYDGVRSTNVGGLQPVYTDAGDTGNPYTKQVYLFTNADDGNEAETFSFSVNKQYDNGLDWTFGYAHTDSKDINPMTSSVGNSNFQNRAFLDPNADELARSNYEIEDRFTLQVNYEKEFFLEDYKSKISLFAVRHSGRPYSLTFSSGMTDGFYQSEDNSLLYIPEGPNDPNVQFAPGFDTAAFFNYLASKDASRYQGGFAPRNAFTSPWFTKIDLMLQQEFPGLREDHKTTAFFVMDNVGNFLDDQLGILNRPSFPYLAGVVDASYSADGSQFIYEEFNPAITSQRDGSVSLWSVTVGIKYDF